MANLARTQPRPPVNAPKARVLLVRQPVKSVRRSDEQNPLAMRLAIGVIAALGSLVLLWLMGHLGFRLGFAARLGVPELLAEPGDGFATAARILIDAPMHVFRAGVAEPLWLMLGFAMIAAPGAALAGVRPPTPGGPRPKAGYIVFCTTAAVVGMISGALVVAYVASPVRARWFKPMPETLSQVEGWLSGLSMAAGMDVLILLSAAAWVVLIFLLTLPLWFRALAAIGTIFALITALTAAAMSGATAAQVETTRSMGFIAGEPTTHLLLGYTRRQAVMMRFNEAEVIVELITPPETFEVVGRVSLGDYLRVAATPLEGIDASRQPSEGFRESVPEQQIRENP